MSNNEKFYDTTWEFINNKYINIIDNKNELNKNEIIIKVENDSNKEEIIIKEISNDETKKEITVNAIENDSVNNEITFNISGNDFFNIFSLDMNENNAIKNDVSNDSNDSSFKENISISDMDTSCTGAITLISDPPSFMDEHMVSKDKERIILSSDPLTEINEILSLEESSENVICSTYMSFQEKIANYEVDSYTKYVIIKTRGSFTSNDGLVLPKRIHWWKGGKLHGNPYVIVATRYLSCRYGAPTHAKVLEKYNVEREKKHKLGLCKRYKKGNGTKKLGCPVKIIAHRLLLFSELKGFNSSPKSKREREELRRIILKKFQNLCYETRYTCVLPDIETHRYHGLGPSNEKEPMDKRILNRIKRLVNAGKTDPDDIAEDLEDFARVELNVNDRNRRRFYPSRLDILHTVNRSRMKMRDNDIEQHKINSMKHIWGDESELCLREMSVGDEEQSNSHFLLVYQNQEMKRLFRLYGNNAVFIDAIHRTCELVWPIYLLVVNTNVNYQVIGFFITQHESKQIIVEGLDIIKSWNPDVKPKYGIVNRPWEEVKALEQAYPDIQIFVSSYHRNFAWEKKVSRRENDGVDRADVLRKLKAVADAVTEEQLKTALTNLKENHSYKLSSAKQYYESTWHFHIKRWAALYWPSDLFFEINNGVHKISNDLNYKYLSHIKRENLFTIIDLLIKNYLPQNLKLYKQKNLQFNINTNNSHQYFRGYASWVVDYLLKVHFEASQLSSQTEVKRTDGNIYLVSYEGGKSETEIRIVPFANIAICSCSELDRTSFICKHIILVGLKFPELHISKISSWLCREPVFRLDDFFFEELVEEPVHENEDFSLEVDYDDHEEEMNDSKNAILQNTNKHLQSKCQTELQSLESMLSLLKDNQLQGLYGKLKDTKEYLSRVLRLENSFYSADEH